MPAGPKAGGREQRYGQRHHKNPRAATGELAGSTGRNAILQIPCRGVCALPLKSARALPIPGAYMQEHTMTARPFGALKQYQNAAIDGASADVAPQKLIDMLLEGALQRLNTARGCMLAGDYNRKMPLVSSALAIIEHLRLCLDHQAGGEIAGNLERLYEYMGRRLCKANLENDADGIEEVAGLLRTLKAAWEAAMQPPARARAG